MITRNSPFPILRRVCKLSRRQLALACIRNRPILSNTFALLLHPQPKPPKMSIQHSPNSHTHKKHREKEEEKRKRDRKIQTPSTSSIQANLLIPSRPKFGNPGPRGGEAGPHTS